MRRAAVLLVGVAAFVAVAGHGVAATLPVPVPEVPTVTVPPLPPVTVPTVTTPTVPTPTAPSPAPATAPAGASMASSGGSSTPSGSSSDTRAAPRPSARRSSSSHTTRTLTFSLARAGLVEITVLQVSPVCRAVRHFSYAGHAGFNRVRFGRQKLAPGTYRISAHTRNGRTIQRMTLVVGKVREANVCAGATSTAAASSGAAANAANVERALQPKSEPLAGGIPAKGANAHSGVLAASLEKTAAALRPVVVFLLALSIILLCVASLPRAAVPDPRVHDLLARHRVDLAGVGAVALLTVALLFLS